VKVPWPWLVVAVIAESIHYVKDKNVKLTPKLSIVCCMIDISSLTLSILGGGTVATDIAGDGGTLMMTERCQIPGSIASLSKRARM
jgi:hypothetical protein